MQLSAYLYWHFCIFNQLWNDFSCNFPWWMLVKNLETIAYNDVSDTYSPTLPSSWDRSWQHFSLPLPWWCNFRRLQSRNLRAAWHSRRKEAVEMERLRAEWCGLGELWVVLPSYMTRAPCLRSAPCWHLVCQNCCSFSTTLTRGNFISLTLKVDVMLTCDLVTSISSHPSLH